MQASRGKDSSPNLCGADTLFQSSSVLCDRLYTRKCHTRTLHHVVQAKMRASRPHLAKPHATVKFQPSLRNMKVAQTVFVFLPQRPFLSSYPAHRVFLMHSCTARVLAEERVIFRKKRLKAARQMYFQKMSNDAGMIQKDNFSLTSHQNALVHYLGQKQRSLCNLSHMTCSQSAVYTTPNVIGKRRFLTAPFIKF